MDFISEYPNLVKAAGGATLATVGYKALDAKTQISYDLKAALRLLPTLKDVKHKCALDEYTMTDVWEEAVAKYGNKTAVVFENRRLSFLDMERTANQMAHWLEQQGIKKGDTVSIDLENKPEFICWWLAASRLGAKCGLLNYNIKGKGLAHCVKVSNAKALICDEDTEHLVAGVQDDLGIPIVFWGGKQPRHVKTDKTVNYDDLLGMPTTEFDKKTYRGGIKFSDIFGFIYTSGTTGLPKAANIMHMKLFTMGALFAGMGTVTEQDTIYTCLPIFHSAGGGIGVAAMMRTGATLCLARKFSAKRFWVEVATHNCTIIQYIGELCRYLVAYAKAHPEVLQLQHCVRLAMGNGLRPEVWDDFQDGFQIQQVLEFYGATEGNGALINLADRSDRAARGAVGRQGKLLQAFMGMKIVKFDIEEEVPLRGKDGRCIECGFGEAGELLMPIREDRPTTKFVGYTDDKSSKKKLIDNAFVNGDKYFRTGDLISKDERGYYYFVDRIGDTFRWKGENVSTTEVSEVVSSFPNIVEANVYGVQVPGSKDGRACLAALTMRNGSDLSSQEDRDKLLEHCKKELPSYARPLFLRILKDGGPSTGTFKQQKVALRNQGMNPHECGDDGLYYLNGGNKYEKIDAAIYEKVSQGGIRF